MSYFAHPAAVDRCRVLLAESRVQGAACACADATPSVGCTAIFGLSAPARHRLTTPLCCLVAMSVAEAFSATCSACCCSMSAVCNLRHSLACCTTFPGLRACLLQQLLALKTFQKPKCKDRSQIAKIPWQVPLFNITSIKSRYVGQAANVDRQSEAVCVKSTSGLLQSTTLLKSGNDFKCKYHNSHHHTESAHFLSPY